ncbi:unnamed protein product [Allacma fusca]|uniref:O-acyltransferase WSD1-like N-terminal domain-containing protein n=1 Tax=Allacma fusca TaxID=39272 RepID=A0A8J2NSC7_9HEXA|nr:unnamed protein product [Allacma fusca]
MPVNSEKIAIVLLTCAFPLILVVPITICTIFLPIWLLILALAKVFHPELEYVSNGFEAGLSHEKSLEPNVFNIASYHVLDGYLSLHIIRQMALENVFSLKKDNGQLLFRRLKSTITFFLGYSFWKVNKTFDISDHIRGCDSGSINMKLPNPCFEVDLSDVMRNLVVLPWKKAMPRWEILVLHIDRSSSNSRPQTVLLGRWHHSIMDGYSYLHLLETIFQEQFDFPTATPSNSPRPTFREYFQKLLPILRIPIDLAESICDGFNIHNRFLPKERNSRKSYYACISEPIDDAVVHKIRKKYDVGYGTVVVAICSGALKRVYDLEAQPFLDTIPSQVVFPVVGHPKVVANHFDFRPVRLPLKSKSSVNRLLETEAQIKRAKRRFLLSPIILFHAIIMPAFLSDILINCGVLARSSFVISVFVAQKSFSLGGCKVLDSAAMFTHTRCLVGGTCLCHGTPSRMRMSLMINKQLISSEEAVLKFSQFVREEADALLET